MKKIWSSPWRPYWFFSFFIIATAIASWWWQAGINWQGSRTIASDSFSDIHPEFLIGLEKGTAYISQGLYQKFAEMPHGTSVCKHYSFDQEEIDNGNYIKGIGKDFSRYCIKGTGLITDVAQNMMDDKQLFMGCCDLKKEGPEHYRYGKKSSGVRACKHFTLKNESAGVRNFFSAVSNHINKFCQPGTLTITEDFIDNYGFSIENKQFVTCCDIIEQ